MDSFLETAPGPSKLAPPPLPVIRLYQGVFAGQVERFFPGLGAGVLPVVIPDHSRVFGVAAQRVFQVLGEDVRGILGQWAPFKRQAGDPLPAQQDLGEIGHVAYYLPKAVICVHFLRGV